MMLGKPHRAVSEPVGEHDLLHALIEGALDAGFGQIRGFEFKKQTQFHGRTSQSGIYAISGGIGKRRRVAGVACFALGGGLLC
jgi:hypothetical protein